MTSFPVYIIITLYRGIRRKAARSNRVGRRYGRKVRRGINGRGTILTRDAIVRSLVIPRYLIARL